MAKIWIPALEQGKRCIETARQRGADEDEAAFDATLAVIARQNPKNESTGLVKVKGD